MTAHAECTWGEGPDVLIMVSPSVPNAWPLHPHPEPGTHSFGLTANEARRLAAELLMASGKADSMANFAEELAEEKGEAARNVERHIIALTSNGVVVSYRITGPGGVVSAGLTFAWSLEFAKRMAARLGIPFVEEVVGGRPV